MIYGQNAELLHPHPRRPGVLRGYAARGLYVTRKAESVRRLLDAANCPGGELAGELLQKMQRLDDDSVI